MKASLLGLFLAIGTSIADHITPLVVRGTEARRGEFPHIIQIKVNNAQYCGGSIVNESWVVTSALCASAYSNSPSRYTLVAGQHNITFEEDEEQVRIVDKVIRHPNFDSGNYSNDIALMRVSKPFTFNDEYVQPVVLPTNPNFKPVYPLTTAGWGAFQEGGAFPTTLQKLIVPLVENSRCRKVYQDRIGKDRIGSGMLCAGGNGRDSCHGDTGGPLMNGTTLLGIVSWGYTCGSETYPGVYTDVRYFIDWINKNETYS